MAVHVVGAGIIGLSTALALVERGFEVEVLDHREPGSDTSHSNAGQLSYSYVAPLAGPDILAKLPQWLLGPGSPTRAYRFYDPGLWPWTMKFLRACTRDRAAKGTAVLGALGRESQGILTHWRERYRLSFDWCQSGKLIIHRDDDEWAGACRQTALQADLGIEQQLLTPAQISAMEPALAHLEGHIRGGVWTPTEEVGDCRKLCLELARTLERAGVRLRRTRVRRIDTDHGRVTGLLTDDGELAADAVVVAAGVGSGALVEPLGIDLPIYPLKGYSLTYEPPAAASVPTRSVTDFHRKVVVAPIGARLRFAGLADLDGYNRRARKTRLRLLRRWAHELVPALADLSPGATWVGLRAATPDSIPLMGRTRVNGLWLNTGQGALGFTLAPASAMAVAEEMGSAGADGARSPNAGRGQC